MIGKDRNTDLGHHIIAQAVDYDHLLNPDKRHPLDVGERLQCDLLWQSSRNLQILVLLSRSARPSCWKRNLKYLPYSLPPAAWIFLELIRLLGLMHATIRTIRAIPALLREMLESPNPPQAKAFWLQDGPYVCRPPCWMTSSGRRLWDPDTL
ncbi:hypothetical protein B7494_g4660 [Chlorociboria aeruginascens]|nr:hypothetical protein B7494_g4660 [Chlorociboria aeruginascens]